MPLHATARPVYLTPFQRTPPHHPASASFTPVQARHHRASLLVAHLLYSTPNLASFTCTLASLTPASITYTPAHAEWEAWLLFRHRLTPRVWLPWYQTELASLPPSFFLLAAILTQAFRDLKRGMPCTYRLYHSDLAWPWSTDYRCTRESHACAPSAFRFLTSQPALDTFAALGLDPHRAFLTALSIRDTILATLPWLTFEVLS